MSASSNPAQEAKGVQSSFEFDGGGDGGVPGGRKWPWRSQGDSLGRCEHRDK
jgi:hypothetical protein